ncbi:delta(8)-fatty-acid desaturase 2 [Cajanus cajan]|uniref:Fatty acid desaturase 1 n=1 Tax=Cajanus cajan TaxID=3821 RepID=A0A151TZ18_CAJCA|nr:delta(8)-fatty-acid desaturase 2 [Cajanus cajan]KYP72238.1 Fatty acid desaturase 1 [Cajanus cajan]
MDPPASYISSSDLANHNTRHDAWISIHGAVYDVTEWLHRHPGGSLPLLTLAGRDATDAFLAFHPPSAAALLPRLSTGLRLRDHAVSPASSDYRRLLSELSRAGLFDRKGHTTLALLSLIVPLLALAVAGVLLSDRASVHLLSAALIGFAWIQSGWIGHDSGHYNVMPTRRLNRLIQILSGNVLAGISIAWWKWNHNAHHISCNSLDFDPDLQHLPFFVVSSSFFTSLTSRFYDRKLNFDSLARVLVSYQHFTFYPVMCFARLNLFAQSFFLLLSNRKVDHRGVELLGLLLFWIWYPLLISFLPNWWERALFVLVSFSVTAIQHVQFCLNHFSSKVYLGPPNGSDWFQIQTNGTLDVSCSSWMDWFHGGLQFQVEHHLFPRLPRCNLRKIAPLVKDLCNKHNLPYNCVSFWKANVLTIQTLRTAALQARDASKPLPKNLVWEAVNTHG